MPELMPAGSKYESTYQMSNLINAYPPGVEELTANVLSKMPPPLPRTSEKAVLNCARRQKPRLLIQRSKGHTTKKPTLARQDGAAVKAHTRLDVVEGVVVDQAGELSATQADVATLKAGVSVDTESGIVSISQHLYVPGVCQLGAVEDAEGAITELQTTVGDHESRINTMEIEDYAGMAVDAVQSAVDAGMFAWASRPSGYTALPPEEMTPEYDPENEAQRLNPLTLQPSGIFAANDMHADVIERIKGKVGVNNSMPFVEMDVDGRLIATEESWLKGVAHLGESVATYDEAVPPNVTNPDSVVAYLGSNALVTVSGEVNAAKVTADSVNASVVNGTKIRDRIATVQRIPGLTSVVNRVHELTRLKRGGQGIQRSPGLASVVNRAHELARLKKGFVLIRQNKVTHTKKVSLASKIPAASLNHLATQATAARRRRASVPTRDLSREIAAVRARVKTVENTTNISCTTLTATGAVSAGGDLSVASGSIYMGSVAGSVGTAANSKIRLYATSATTHSVQDYVIGVASNTLTYNSSNRHQFLSDGVETALLDQAGNLTVTASVAAPTITATALAGNFASATTFASDVSVSGCLNANAGSGQGNYAGISLFGAKSSLYSTYVSNTTSWTGGTACSLGTVTSYALRFRTNAASNARGFIFEDSTDTALMSLSAVDGNLQTKGTITAPSAAITSLAGSTGTFTGDVVSTNCCYALHSAVVNSTPTQVNGTTSNYSVSGGTFTARGPNCVVAARGAAYVSGGSGTDISGVSLVLYNTNTSVYITGEGYKSGMVFYADRTSNLYQPFNDSFMGLTTGTVYAVRIRAEHAGNDVLNLKFMGFSVVFTNNY